MDETSVLNAIAEGRMTRDEAAAALKVTPRHVNRLMQQRGIARPKAPSDDEMAKKSAKRMEIELELAKLAIPAYQCKLTVRELMQRFNLAERTAYRTLKRLRELGARLSQRPLDV